MQVQAGCYVPLTHGACYLDTSKPWLHLHGALNNIELVVFCRFLLSACNMLVSFVQTASLSPTDACIRFCSMGIVQHRSNSLSCISANLILVCTKQLCTS